MKDEVALAMCFAAAIVLLVFGAAMCFYSETIRLAFQTEVVYPFREPGILSLTIGTALLFASAAGYAVKQYRK